MSGESSSALATFSLHPEAYETVFAIYFYGRSGSYLLASMLDNHPTLLSVSPESLAEFLPRLQGLAQENTAHSAKDLSETIANLFPKLFKDNGTLQSHIIRTSRFGKDKNDLIGIDRALFVSFLELSLKALNARGQTIDYRSLFGAIHAAYAHAANRTNIAEPPSIVWNLHYYQPYHDAIVREKLGNVRFITMIRRPEKTLDSHFRYHLEEAPFDEPSKLPARLLQMLANSDGAAENAIAVRFEDLHRTPEKTLRALTGWMDLPWSPTLLESTFDGKTWWWNGERTGTDPTVPDNRETPYLSSIDRWKIRYAFAKNYAAWRYTPVIQPWEPLGRLIFNVLLALPLRIGFRALAKDLERAQNFGDRTTAWKALYKEHLNTRRILKTIRLERDQGKELLPVLDLEEV